MRISGSSRKPRIQRFKCDEVLVVEKAYFYYYLWTKHEGKRLDKKNEKYVVSDFIGYHFEEINKINERSRICLQPDESDHMDVERKPDIVAITNRMIMEANASDNDLIHLLDKYYTNVDNHGNSIFFVNTIYPFVSLQASKESMENIAKKLSAVSENIVISVKLDVLKRLDASINPASSWDTLIDQTHKALNTLLKKEVIPKARVIIIDFSSDGYAAYVYNDRANEAISIHAAINPKHMNGYGYKNSYSLGEFFPGKNTLFSTIILEDLAECCKEETTVDCRLDKFIKGLTETLEKCYYFTYFYSLCPRSGCIEKGCDECEKENCPKDHSENTFRIFKTVYKDIKGKGSIYLDNDIADEAINGDNQRKRALAKYQSVIDKTKMKEKPVEDFDTPIKFDFKKYEDSIISSILKERKGSVASIDDICRRIPIVFGDEFDCSFENNQLGWLKYFLSPMEDGECHSLFPYTDRHRLSGHHRQSDGRCGGLDKVTSAFLHLSLKAQDY